jgi:hypothetical protein
MRTGQEGELEREKPANTDETFKENEDFSREMSPGSHGADPPQSMTGQDNGERPDTSPTQPAKANLSAVARAAKRKRQPQPQPRIGHAMMTDRTPTKEKKRSSNRFYNRARITADMMTKKGYDISQVLNMLKKDRNGTYISLDGYLGAPKKWNIRVPNKMGLIAELRDEYEDEESSETRTKVNSKDRICRLTREQRQVHRTVTMGTKNHLEIIEEKLKQFEYPCKLEPFVPPTKRATWAKITSFDGHDEIVVMFAGHDYQNRMAKLLNIDTTYNNPRWLNSVIITQQGVEGIRKAVKVNMNGFTTCVDVDMEMDAQQLTVNGIQAPFLINGDKELTLYLPERRRDTQDWQPIDVLEPTNSYDVDNDDLIMATDPSYSLKFAYRNNPSVIGIVEYLDNQKFLNDNLNKEERERFDQELMEIYGDVEGAGHIPLQSENFTFRNLLKLGRNIIKEMMRQINRREKPQSEPPYVSQ